VATPSRSLRSRYGGEWQKLPVHGELGSQNMRAPRHYKCQWPRNVLRRVLRQRGGLAGVNRDRIATFANATVTVNCAGPLIAAVGRYGEGGSRE